MKSQQLRRGGTKTNEDLVTVTETAAWVLDGTSGTQKRNLTNHPDSDGVWYVEQINDYLRTALTDRTRSLEEIVFDAVEHVTMTYDTILDQESPYVKGTNDANVAVGVDDIPGATIALLRWDTTTVEYFCLGDSVALFNTETGVDRVFHGDPERFDAINRAHLAELREQYPDKSYTELYEEIRPYIRDARRLREIPGGYWGLGMNPLSARFAVTGEYSREALTSAYLFTDGFDPLVELFGLFDSWEEAVAFMEEHGIEAAATKLREAESADEHMHSYPRLKPHDDIAIANIEF